MIPSELSYPSKTRRHQRSDLSRKIDVDVQPVYTSQKIKGQFKPKDHKPPIVNQQNVVYLSASSTGGGVQAINNRQPRKVGAWKGSRDHYKQFQSLKKCQSKRDCLIFEMLFSLLNIFYCFYNLKVSFITYAVILLHPYSNLLATGLHSARAEAKKITFFEFTWEVEESSFYVVTRGNNSNKS